MIKDDVPKEELVLTDCRNKLLLEITKTFHPLKMVNIIFRSDNPIRSPITEILGEKLTI